MKNIRFSRLTWALILAVTAGTFFLGVFALVEFPKHLSEQTDEKSFTNSIGMKLVLIPAGKFMMGSADSEKDRKSDEEPQHEVEITKPFHMSIHEVTQEEYKKVMWVNPSWFSTDNGNEDKIRYMNTRRFPVENVSWEEAVEFCRNLSARPAERRAGLTYRLPTEAEWEYACRAGSTTVFHYGDTLTSTQANFDGNHPFGGADKGPYLERTAQVGSYCPNAFGLYDMHGNVLEWCADWYDKDYYKQSPAADPRGPMKARYRVVRGGDLNTNSGACRSAARRERTPDLRLDLLGFRVVADQSER